MIDTTTIPATEARTALTDLLGDVTTAAQQTTDLDRTLTRQQRMLLSVLIEVAQKAHDALGGER